MNAGYIFPSGGLNSVLFSELSLFPIREEEEGPAAAAAAAAASSFRLAHNGQEKLAPSTIAVSPTLRRAGKGTATRPRPNQPTPLSPTAVNSAGDKLRS